MLYRSKFVAKFIIAALIFCLGPHASAGTKAAAKKSYHKHIARISFNNQTFAGVIIMAKAILSAAHFVTLTPYIPINDTLVSNAKACAGSTLGDCKSPSTQFRNVDAIILHDNYTGLYYGFNVAIFVLEKPFVDDGITVMSIRIPIRPILVDTVCDFIKWDDSECFASSLVISAALEYTDMEIISREACEEHFVLKGASYMCALKKDNTTELCNNNMGNALICDAVLTGILASFNSTSSEPKVFTDIYYTRGWINKQLELLTSYWYYEPSIVLWRRNVGTPLRVVNVDLKLIFYLFLKSLVNIFRNREI